MVCRKVAGLEFEEKGVQLLLLLLPLLLFLAFVSVFERTWMVWQGLDDPDVPRPDQRYEIAKAIKTHTFLPSGMLLAGGEGGA